MDTVLAVIAGFPSGYEFISDDVFSRCPPCPGDARAMGAALMRARKEGLIEPTGALRKSHRPGCHANLVSVWRRR